MQQFILGLKHFIAATGFMAKHKLLHYYLFPLLLSILFYIGITAFTLSFAKSITDYLIYQHVPVPSIDSQNVPSFFSFFNANFVQNVTAVIVGLVVFFVAAKISKYLVLIILSPLFAYLSEVVEEKITGNVYPFVLSRFLQDIWRGIRIALRNFIIEFALIGLFTLVGFFIGPFAILIVPILWLVSAYFYGFSMIDYTCERRRLSVKQGIAFIREHRTLAVANGSLYALLDIVPLIGLMVAPINAVVGATTALLAIEKSK
jgi:CysZ protein